MICFRRIVTVMSRKTCNEPWGGSLSTSRCGIEHLSKLGIIPIVLRIRTPRMD